MKAREKTIVGVGLMAGGIFLMMQFGLPQWDQFTANLNTINSAGARLQNFQATRDALANEVRKLRNTDTLPAAVQIREFSGDNLQEMVKGMLDDVVGFAAANNNKLVQLKPYAADPFIKPPQLENDNTPFGQKKELTPEQEKQLEESRQLQTIGYELVIRGTYGTIQSFLKDMEQYGELVEISSIELVNEAGADRSGTDPLVDGGQADVLFDPSRPIRATMNLRLGLKRAGT